MSKVFVIQATRHQADVSPARAYGDVVFILGAGDRTSCSPAISAAKLEAGLKGFEETHDYILWAGGDPLSMLLAGTVLYEMGVNSFRYLRYERGDSKQVKSAPFYVPVTVNFPETETPA